MFGHFALWEINREERFYCALLAHAVLSSASARQAVCAAINALEEVRELRGGQEVRDIRLSPDDLEVYVEVAALRDFWNRLDRSSASSAVSARLAVLRTLFEKEALPVEILDHAVFRTSTGKVPSPAHWNLDAIEQAFPALGEDGSGGGKPSSMDRLESLSSIDRIKVIKWAFNAKPDLLFVSGKLAVFVEAKVESDEDRYEGWCPQSHVQRKIGEFIRRLAPRYCDTDFCNTLLLLRSKGDGQHLVWADLVAALSAIHQAHPEEVDAFTMRCFRQLAEVGLANRGSTPSTPDRASASEPYDLQAPGAVFLWEVLNRMEGHPGAVVRFGTTGKGLRPNYEIAGVDGITVAFNGGSHEALPEGARFDGAHLSESFTLEQLAACIDGMAKPEFAQEWMGRYYAANKGRYPAEIRSHGDALRRLIAAGTPAAVAFDQVAGRGATS